MADEYQSISGKRPLWQWILIYAAVGLVIYGLIYYFVFARKGGSNYNPVPTASPVGTVTSTLETTSSATQAAQATVVLTADAFSPATLTVKVGTEVVWNNQSGSGATVNSDPHPAHTTYPPLNLGSFQNGETLVLTFDKTGTYGYHNHLNPNQRGTIIVQ